MSVDQVDNKERIDFLTKEVRLNRSLRYNNQGKYTPEESDEMEAELRKLDPDSPLFYKLRSRNDKINEIIKIASILLIVAIIFVGFLWYFYMFYYDPIIYNP